MVEYTEGQKSYIKGVEETASNVDKLVYINPNVCAPVYEKYGIDYNNISSSRDLLHETKAKLKSLSPEQRTEFLDELEKTIGDHIEEQIPGGRNELMVNTSGLSWEMRLGKIANYAGIRGPGASDNCEVNGKTYGIAVLPSVFFDTKEKLLRSSLEGRNFGPKAIDKIIEKAPGTEEEYMEFVGNHEGGHIDGKSFEKTPRGKLEEEVKADTAASEQTTKDGNPELAQYRLKFRALLLNHEEHATQVPLFTGDKVTNIQAEITQTLIKTMEKDVADNCDLGGKVPFQLLREKPDAYFEALNKAIEQKIVDAKLAYKQNPDDPEVAKQALAVQVYADNAHLFEAAYRQYALDEDFPDPKPTQILSQEDEDKISSELYQDRNIKYYEDFAKSVARSQFNPLYAQGFPYDGNEEEQMRFPIDYLERLRDEATERYANNLDDEVALKHAIFVDYAIECFGADYNKMIKNDGLNQAQMDLAPIVPEDVKLNYYRKKIANGTIDDVIKIEEKNPQEEIPGFEILEDEPVQGCGSEKKTDDMMAGTNETQEDLPNIDIDNFVKEGVSIGLSPNTSEGLGDLDFSPEYLQQRAEELEKIARRQEAPRVQRQEVQAPQTAPLYARDEGDRPIQTASDGSLYYDEGEDPLAPTSEAGAEAPAERPTISLNSITPSDVTVNFDERKTMVGDKPVTEHFAQATNPPATNPDSTITEEQPHLPIAQM